MQVSLKGAQKAASAFKQLPDIEKLEAAYVFDDSFEGIIKSTLPSFWTEELSHIYAHLDLNELGQQGKERKQTDKIVNGEAKRVADAKLDEQILRLRQEGIGQQKIARLVGCSEWRVQKCLKG